VHKALYDIPISKGTEKDDDNPESQQELNQIALKAIEFVETKRKTRSKIISSVAASFAMIVLVFFVFTSPGQAFADTVYKTFTELFNGNMVVQHGDNDQPAKVNLEVGTSISVQTVQEAANYFEQDFLYLTENNISLEEISIERMDGFTVALSKYKFMDDYIFIQQQFYDNKTMLNSIVPTEEENYQEIEMFNGINLYYAVTPENNYIGVATWDNIQLQIMAEGISEQDLKSFIQNIKAL
jgi:hypothetical protein